MNKKQGDQIQFIERQKITVEKGKWIHLLSTQPIRPPVNELCYKIIVSSILYKVFFQPSQNFYHAMEKKQS